MIALVAGALAAALPAHAAEDPGDRARVEREGRAPYLRLCAPCHGASGRGDGPSARFLPDRPRDFRASAFRLRRTPAGTPPLPADLERTVRAGMPGTSMPAFGTALPPQLIALLARYVMTLGDRAWDGEAPRAIEIPPAPAPDGASLARGRLLYDGLCASCHGPRGRGDGPAAAALVDATGAPAPPADLARPPYKGGAGPEVVYRAISTGLDGTPMPALGAALTPGQRWDLAHYVVSLGPPP